MSNADAGVASAAPGRNSTEMGSTSVAPLHAEHNHEPLPTVPLSPTSLHSSHMTQEDTSSHTGALCVPSTLNHLQHVPLNSPFPVRGESLREPLQSDYSMPAPMPMTQDASASQPLPAPRVAQATQPSPTYSDVAASAGDTSSAASRRTLLLRSPDMFRSMRDFMPDHATSGLTAENMDSATFDNPFFLEDALIPDLSLNPADDSFLGLNVMDAVALPPVSLHTDLFVGGNVQGSGGLLSAIPFSSTTAAAPAATANDLYLQGPWATVNSSQRHATFHEHENEHGHARQQGSDSRDRQQKDRRDGRGEVSSQHGRSILRITANDISILEENITAADVYNMQPDLKMPTASAVMRALNAYMQYFDPHTPIIHWPTFSIANSQPALILAMIAIGARHLSEFGLAERAYDAAVVLLSQHEIEASWCDEQQLSLWPIQATLLCAQFGAFCDDKARARRAQYQLSFASTMLRHGLDAVSRLKMMPVVDWSTWIYLQTYSRLASWATILFAIVLSYDPNTSCIITNQPFELPMPKDRNMWCARSSHEWKQQCDEEDGVHHLGETIGRANSSSSSRSSSTDTRVLNTGGGEIGLFTASKMLLQGETVPVQVTSFGLLVLIGAILSYICSHERLSVGLGDVFRSDFTARMEQSLATWEQMWRAHPLAEQVPSRLGDSLMADCLSLLGSARYHLYVGKHLLGLKSIAVDPQSLFHPEQFWQASTGATTDVCKAVRYAANSWLVRIKIGLALLERMAALEFGGHALVTAYEGALILSWWLALDERRRMAFTEVAGPRERTLDQIFEEIFELLAEQGLVFTNQPRYFAPIIFYRRLMAPAFWTYGMTMAQNLENFSLRLGQM
ncbi:hypothetical protein SEUCBS140593_010164 [Sporothrix eucalyptigena]|uniref:Xylanolytic transcriptional activator regulatory domain-containing protein n=1 Tax=Sporothrix eucalyptigena TaxID=1812306 RepID=A0ABP0D354_9PEZI